MSTQLYPQNTEMPRCFQQWKRGFGLLDWGGWVCTRVMATFQALILADAYAEQRLKSLMPPFPAIEIWALTSRILLCFGTMYRYCFYSLAPNLQL